ncbi:hypothetical protein scyTo_0017704, partial [Scyliorhinus torazame]|nr:hypothetical protein [Scyliorhinus torazame]
VIDVRIRFGSLSRAVLKLRLFRRTRFFWFTAMAEQIFEIDGGIMEGGGQILRVCTALSCLLGAKIKIYNIRAGRSTPGLRSVCLLMQVSIPCVLFAASPSELILRGGTNAEMAPQIDYTLEVFKPVIEKFGFQYSCDLKMRGYYPKGGGEVRVKISPVKQLTPINMTERGTITKIHGRAFVAGVLPFKLANEMASAAVRCIRKEMRDIYVNIQSVQEPKDKAYGNGNGIIVFAETSTGCIIAGSALGKRGVAADKVGIEAAEMLMKNIRHGGCVDQYLQDQIIIFMALAKGVSRVRSGPLTLHTQTAIHFAEMLTKAKFTVNKLEDQESGSESNIIECEGIGMMNPSF